MNKPRRADAQRPGTLVSPIIQVMSGARARLDPTIVPQLASWLIAATLPWVRAIERPRIEGSEAAKFQRKKMDMHYQSKINAINDVVGRLYETADMADIDDARDLVFAALGPAVAKAEPEYEPQPKKTRTPKKD